MRVPLKRRGIGTVAYWATIIPSGPTAQEMRQLDLPDSYDIANQKKQDQRLLYHPKPLFPMPGCRLGLPSHQGRKVSSLSDMTSPHLHQ